MNSAQRRTAFRSIIREFIPGLSVVMPTGKTAQVVGVEVHTDNRTNPHIFLKRADNRKVSIPFRNLSIVR